MKSNYKLNRLMTSMILAGGLTTPLAAVAVETADTEKDKSNVEVIEVKGFRGSLSRSMHEKRQATNSKESIMSEDIGKFPDLNIAESLQRVPGVAISREGGEGRQITLRGLGPSFTRTTLNGMEVPASTDGTDSGGGVNGGRAFDFNVFASELFNRVDIQKSSTASTEEGGIAGTVDLYSAKPFDKPGLNVGGSVQGGYNDVTGEVDPRLAFMFSNTFADDTVGVLFSVAQSKRTVRQEGFGTVRWTNPVADGGGLYADTSNTVVTGTPSGTCQDDGVTVDALNCLWTPRLPRPDFFGNEQERLGITGSLQWAPTDDFVLTLDTLLSSLDNKRTMYNFFEMFRSTFDEITPVAVTIAPNGKQIQAGTFDGIKSRIESREQISSTDFSQFVLNGKYILTDEITIDAMVGTAESDSRSAQYRYNMTNDTPHTFSFDYANNPDVPDVEYGYDVNDASMYNLSDGRLRATDVLRSNDTVKLDVNYLADEVSISAGFAYNDRTVDYSEEQINGFPDQASAVGYTKPLPYDDFGSGFDGNLNSFIVADFNKINANLLPSEWTQRFGQSRKIQEETVAAYVQADKEFELGDMILRSNAGLRFVNTTTNATGFIGDETVTISNEYDNLLPSVNLALDATEDVVVRLGLSKTMTRPSLSSLNPGNPSFSYLNGTVSSGNPYLDPFVSNNIDIGAEWYFNDESVVAVNFFYKDIETFIQSSSEDKFVDPAYLPFIYADPQYDPQISLNPETVKYTHNVPVNGEGETMKGFEISYQQPFTFLPAPFDGLGIVANYTKVSVVELTGLSENSYNATLYYERDNYGARISANNRDDYITDYSGSNGNIEHGTTGPTHMDVSAFYNLNENLTLTFEIINLTDEYERLYTTGDGTLNLSREYNHTGTQFFFGARYSM